MTISCHYCGTVENLKAYVCGGHCPREQEHNTSICMTCFCRNGNVPIQEWEKKWDTLTYNWKPKLKEFDQEKTWKAIVSYYVDKKGYPLEKAEEIAKQKIQEQIELRKLVPK